MYNIINNSKSGMSASQNKIDVISNNIANSNTTGYKKLEVEFQELITEKLYKNSYNDKAQTGTGIKTSNIFRNYEQGALKNTEIASNLAIDGEGFFRVIMADGSYAYTRNGEFNINSEGKLVDGSGNLLQIQFNEGINYSDLKLSNKNLSINKNGDVIVDNKLIGKINTYTSVGDNDFLSIGDSLYKLKNDNNIIQAQNSSILQGYVEMSNVNLSQEMTDLITTQRLFQFNGKGINVADDMWSMVNNLQSR